MAREFEGFCSFWGFYLGFWESAPMSRAFEHSQHWCVHLDPGQRKRPGTTLVQLSTPTPLSNTKDSTGLNSRTKAGAIQV